MPSDIPIPIAGYSSAYPYGVDAFPSLTNFRSAQVGDEGDLILARHRNHMADAVVMLETDLLNATTSYDGDMRTAAFTAVVEAVRVNTAYFAQIPPDMVTFLVGANARLDDITKPLTYLFGARPAAAAGYAPWGRGIDYTRSYQHILNMLTGSSTGGVYKSYVVFQVWDRSNLAQDAYYAAHGHLGSYIISAIFFANG